MVDYFSFPRVDMEYIDIGAIVELSDNCGEMFESAEGRESFFRRVKLDPTSISYGAALSHAKGVNIGIWGRDDLLYKDCAKIMAAEFRRIEVEYDIKLGITEEELRNSQEFRKAYEMSRAPKQAATHNLVRSLGTNSERLPYAEAMITKKDVHDLGYLHNRIIDELRNQQRFKKKDLFEEEEDRDYKALVKLK